MNVNMNINIYSFEYGYDTNADIGSFDVCQIEIN